MSGSALGLFLCRGCRLHLMLRPAFLLPVVRLSPRGGLCTPGSSVEVFLERLGPATRRSGAYRRGTLTRWRSAACRRRTHVSSLVCGTTHHRLRLTTLPRSATSCSAIVRSGNEGLFGGRARRPIAQALHVERGHEQRS